MNAQHHWSFRIIESGKSLGVRRLKSWDTGAILFLILWAPLYFLPVTLGERVFNGGDLSQFSLPASFVLGRALAEGRLPFWEPAMSAGFPLLAALDSTALYPVTLILYRVVPFPHALSYNILFHLVWASLGMYLWTRAIGSSVAGAWLAGFTFGFGGFALGHLTHLSLLITTVWLPWLLLCQEYLWRAYRAQKRIGWWVGLTSIVVAMQVLGGFAQFVAYAFILYGLFILIRAETRAAIRAGRRGLRALVSIGGWMCAPLGVGVGLAAIQLLPALELMTRSVRHHDMAADFVTSFSLPLDALAQFVSPFAWTTVPNVVNQEYWVYFGVSAWALATSAWLWRREERRLLCLGIAVVALVLALGSATPLYAIFLHVPILNRFRVPARWLYCVAFAGSALAGIGLDEWRARLRETNSRAAWGIGAMVGVSVLGVLWLRTHGAIEWLALWQVLPWGLGVVTVGALLLAYRQRMARSAFTVTMLGATILDVTLFALPFSYEIAMTTAPAALREPPLSIRVMDASSPLDRMFTNVYNETLRPNYPLVYGKASAQIYHPLELKRNAEYLGVLTAPMLNLLGVRYYVLPNAPLPEEFAEPTASVLLDPLRARVEISPTRVARVQVVSYTDRTRDQPNDFCVGEIVLTSATGSVWTLPLRLGRETADWAYYALPQMNHRLPQSASAFLGYSLANRRAFDGLKYLAEFTAPTPFEVVTLEARSVLPAGQLTIERVVLIDDTGQATTLATLAQRNDFVAIFKSHAVTLLENSARLPRAFIAHRAERVEDAHILARMRDPAWQPERLVFLEEMPLWSSDETRAFADTVTITNYRAERIELSVTAEEAGYVVLTDTWYPGWEARVDGVPTPIARADYIFRAVPVARGQHSLVFEYHPRLFWLGALISASSLGIAVLLALRKRAARAIRLLE